MSSPRVILRTPWGGPWRLFSAPDEIFQAYEPGDVRACLADVDAAVRSSGRSAAGFIAYEAAAAFGLPTFAPPANGLPLVWFGVYSPDRISIVDSLVRQGAYQVDGWRPSISHDDYRSGVGTVRQRIEAGDTYQINYTWRLTSRFEGDPLSLLVDLDEAQGGEWSAYLDIGRHVICSASPELFFLLEGGRIECRPMKGTSRRGLSADDDLERAAALRASDKNRAENVMVVDMTRNDLGRLARIGSVQVLSLYDVERYPRQWQMVSRVGADVESPLLPALFEALFPSGSVTGAPKHSSMEIISRVESESRGIYTGAIGFFSRERAHFNVAIRTVAVDRHAGTATFGVGSGIVWDSIEGDEYEECLLKASILTERRSTFDLLESIGWSPDQGFALLDGHLNRLRASAAYFRFAPVAPERILEALSRAVEGRTQPQKVRLLLSRDGGVRCAAGALSARPDPLRAALAGHPVVNDDVFLYHKTTRRDVYETAQRERPDVDAVILWNSDGELTEAADANVVVEIDGQLVTPPVACGLLPGVKRSQLLASGEVVERRVRLDELRQASRVWLINSVRGWMPAELDHSSPRSL